jgi:hypothetical protein
MKVQGLVPNSYVHVCVMDLCIPRIGLPIWLSKIGRPILGIYKSLTDTRLWKLGDNTVLFLGTHKSESDINIGFSLALHLR